MTLAEWLRGLNEYRQTDCMGVRIHDERGNQVMCAVLGCGAPASMSVNIDINASAAIGREDRFEWRCPRHGGYISICSRPEHASADTWRTLASDLAALVEAAERVRHNTQGMQIFGLELFEKSLDSLAAAARREGWEGLG